MAKKNFYAIKEGKFTRNKIVDSWEECEKLIKGYPAKYKGFATKEQALEYLGIDEDIQYKSYTISINTKDHELFVNKCNSLNKTQEEIIQSLILNYILS